MFSIEVVMTDNSIYAKVPYHWIIWDKSNKSECVVAAGWGATPIKAYEEAEDFYKKFISKESETIPNIL